MSASLVGSEMCIRDSATTAEASRAKWAQQPGSSQAPGSECEAQPPRGVSVSYTHLTLPTICSV
eukprot:3048546-Alexandrium_andersonii.AAC.1